MGYQKKFSYMEKDRAKRLAMLEDLGNMMARLADCAAATENYGMYTDLL